MANGINSKLQGLLAGGNPLLDIGIGLLGASGPRPVGTSTFGTRLAEASQFASQRARAGLETQAMRDALAQQKRQQEAQTQLAGLLSGASAVNAPSTQQITAMDGGLLASVPGRKEVVPTIQTPQGRQQLMGLLAEISPETAVQMAVSQMMPGQREYASPIGKMIGDLEAVEASGNEVAAAQLRTAIQNELGSGVDLSEVRGVRNDIIRNSTDFLESKEGFERVMVGSQAATAAGDLALIFGYMKVLDPGSTVREGEAAMVENAAGIPERIRNMYNRILSGERLSPEQRADFLKQAQEQFKQRNEAQMALIEDARGFAERNSLPVADVVPSYLVPQELPEIGAGEASRTSPASGVQGLLQDIQRDFPSVQSLRDRLSPRRRAQDMTDEELMRELGL